LTFATSCGTVQEDAYASIHARQRWYAPLSVADYCTSYYRSRSLLMGRTAGPRGSRSRAGRYNTRHGATGGPGLAPGDTGSRTVPTGRTLATSFLPEKPRRAHRPSLPRHALARPEWCRLERRVPPAGLHEKSRSCGDGVDHRCRE
jgi:hypothetical protein